MRAETIDDVKGEADGIIDWGHDRRTRLGYFPALYRKVTVEVKKGIEDGFFEDGKRMERLDRIAGKTENAIINLSMGNAREFAWRTALELAPLSEAERASRVERLDRDVTKIARIVRRPGLLIGAVNKIIRLGERGSIREIIDILA